MDKGRSKSNKPDRQDAVLKIIITALLSSQITIMIAWASLDSFLIRRSPWVFDKPLILQRIDSHDKNIKILADKLDRNVAINAEMAADIRVMRHIIETGISEGSIRSSRRPSYSGD